MSIETRLSRLESGAIGRGGWPRPSKVVGRVEATIRAAAGSGPRLEPGRPDVDDQVEAAVGIVVEVMETLGVRAGDRWAANLEGELLG